MKKKFFLKITSVFVGLMGVGILIWVFFPIVLYEFSSTAAINLISPIPDTSASDGIADLTKASNWFVGGKPSSDFANSKVAFYNISVPKLKIKKAVVAIGGEDLADSLIQYPGTAVPGKSGNAVIFGHSILPQFYNPESYLSIFSLLPKLQSGDEIFIDYDGISYKFIVETKFEVLPTDIQVLEQNLSDSFITLVTCVPPGDPRRPRRLIVRARIAPVTQNYGNTWN